MKRREKEIQLGGETLLSSKKKSGTRLERKERREKKKWPAAPAAPGSRTDEQITTESLLSTSIWKTAIDFCDSKPESGLQSIMTTFVGK